MVFSNILKFVFLVDTPSLSSEATIVHEPKTHHSTTSISNSSSSSSSSSPPSSSSAAIIPSDPSSWVMAPVFVPKQRLLPPPPTAPYSSASSSQSYAQVASSFPTSLDSSSAISAPPPHRRLISDEESAAYRMLLLDHELEQQQPPPVDAVDMYRIGMGCSVLCPYFKAAVDSWTGDEQRSGPLKCRYGDKCFYDHGDLCEMCKKWCLHPTDAEQRKDHEVVSASSFFFCRFFFYKWNNVGFVWMMIGCLWFYMNEAKRSRANVCSNILSAQTYYLFTSKYLQIFIFLGAKSKLSERKKKRKQKKNFCQKCWFSNGVLVECLFDHICGIHICQVKIFADLFFYFVWANIWNLLIDISNWISYLPYWCCVKMNVE